RIHVTHDFPEKLRAEIHDLRGRRLAAAHGRQRISLDARRHGAGVHLFSVHTPSASWTARLPLLTAHSIRFNDIRSGVARRVTAVRPDLHTVSAAKDGRVSGPATVIGDTASGVMLVLADTAGGKTPADYVNPFIGTAVDHGQLSPAASVPWGMVKPGPDTDPGGHTGYDYNSIRMKGFSHIRIGGVGCEGAGGSVLIRPGTGTPAASVTYDKSSERAQPGYYAVTLGDPAITAELTATGHTGFHRYTFPASENAFINIDMLHCYEGCCYPPEYSVVDTREVQGKVSAGSTCCLGRYTLYFNALFDTPCDSIVSFDDGVVGYHAAPAGRKVLVKIGFSPLSAAQARAEREAEIPGWDFDSVKAAARDAWNEVLGRVSVSGREDRKTLFYTCLYRSCMIPMEMTSTENTYWGTDCRVHQVSGAHYNSWSLWDTFRTKYPLLSLVAPARLQDMITSLVRLDAQGRSWDSGECEPVPTVRTEHMLAIVTDAYRKGLRGFDADKAYAGMKEDVSGKHVAEKSWNYWCLGKMAAALGRTQDRQTFLARAAEWMPQWEQDFKNVMGDPSADKVSTALYECSPWQFRWFVPHDIQGIINIVGGRSVFVNQLRYFFENDLYNHGNEPDLHAAYLFSFAGAPWLTQQWVYRILTGHMVQRYGTHGFLDTPYRGRIYRNRPEGYIPEMDDDAGTMAAWYALSAMGLYQVCVGEPVFEISTPIFDQAVLRLDPDNHGGTTFTIRANGLSDSSFYIQSAALNGVPLDRPWIAFDEIAAGGTLAFEMGAEPDTQWGADRGAAPPSMSSPID
ncbi:MAG: hypothetical protein GF418_11850, partial [Chitinivibrionales bacterium]|nr:hypothetical protein [Chitinivibrionales bacterium]MBD3396310.1 hypothetical protein [Chitinivibrionales bacterium]